MRKVLVGLLLLSSGCLQRSPFQPGTLFITTNVESPSTLLLHGNYLYVGGYSLDAKKGLVGRVPITGGALQTLATWSQQLAPRHMVTDGVNLYLTVITATSNSGQGQIWCLPLDGQGGVKVLATGQNGVCGIAVDSNYVYWGAFTSNSGSFQISRWSKSGGDTPTQLQTAAAGPFTGTPTGNGGCDIVADTNNVYWVDPDFGQLIMQPKDGSAAPSAITTSEGSGSSSQNYPGDAGLASGDGYVYWVGTNDSGGGVISRVELADALSSAPIGAQSVVTDARITTLALDGSQIYWVRAPQLVNNKEQDNGFIMRASIASGSASRFSLVGGSPVAVVVGSAYVYWADDGSGGTIMRLPKR